MVRWRRHFHQHPELGFAEEQTAEYIAEVLSSLGYEVHSGIAGTGVLGVLHGDAGSGKTVALRADMDALPVEEISDNPYRSQNPGVMHACGHDAHMAVALGTAAVLSRLKAQLCGTVKFIFQPAEEGPGGAVPMIAAGVMRDPQVDYVLGGHVWHDVPVGKIAVQPGPMMAATNKWLLTIHGRGGHGAQPHLCIDAVAIAAQAVVAIQQIVSRTNNPQDPAVVTVGMFHAGTRDNIIAEKAELAGTLRAMNEENRQHIQRLLREIIAGVCAPFGAEFELSFPVGYDATLNDADLTAAVIRSATAILGTEQVITKLEPSMAAEDFSYFAQEAPGCYLRLGINDGILGTHPLHHNCFDINEDALPTGAMVFAQTIVDLLDTINN